MRSSKEELVRMIEAARRRLNNSIESGEPYKKVYQRSVELDRLIERYVVSEF